MPVVVADLIARLRADTTQFKSAMASAQTTTATTGSKISSSMGMMAKSIGAGFAIYQVSNFVKGAIVEAEEAQRVARQTAAVIKSTGGVAGVSAKQVEQYATKLSRLAAIDDEVVQSSSNMLLTFKNIGGELFYRTQKAVVDTAAGFAALHNTEIDLASATIQIGKAMNDPIAGLTALKRVGVDFSDSQKQNIADMMAFGNIAGAQKIILQELESQFSGSAEAGVTASQRLGVAWDGFKEMIGKAVLPIIERITPVFQGILDWASKNGPTIATALKIAFLPLWLAYEAGVKLYGILQKLNPFSGPSNQFGPPGNALFPTAIPQKAAGGPASGMTWVGERGPELVSLPSGSYVHNNRDSMAMAGGGGMMVVVNVGGSVISEGRLIDKIHEGLLKKKRKSGSLDL